MTIRIQPYFHLAQLLVLAVLLWGGGGGGGGGGGAVRALEFGGEEIRTHLYALETEVARLGESDGSGGAAASMGNDLLVVTAKGRIALVHASGDVKWLRGRVPMNVSGWESTESFGENKKKQHFRVAGILLKEMTPGRSELFVSHHYFAEECVRFRLSSTIVEATFADGEKTVTVSPSWRTIFDAEPCLKPPRLDGYGSGGRMLTDGPDHLLLTIGDHRRDGRGRYPTPRSRILADDPGSHMGKLVRVAIETGETEILTLGHRNPQGLARDRTGNLWSTEHGPRAGDELNLLEPGGNYGWPHVTYGVDYGRKVPSTIEYGKVGAHDGFVTPVFAWVPAIAPSAIVVNDERSFPLWRDDLLVASLRAKSIFRIRRLGERVQYVEKIRIGIPIRDMAWMPDGRLALLYPKYSNKVAFLSRSQRHCDAQSRKRRDVYAADCESGVAESAAAADPGERLWAQHCSSCHGADPGKQGDAPRLSGAVGRRAGRLEGYEFSDALASLDHVWTWDSLVRFLVDPQAFAPGTSMSEVEVTEAEARVIVNFIDYRGRILTKTLGDRSGDYRRIIDADFDVYRLGRKLVYVKAPCNEEDRAPTFFLHLAPEDESDLPDERKRHGFDNLDFSFTDHRNTFADGACSVTVELPGYPVKTIRTGQFTKDADGKFHHPWKESYGPGRSKQASATCRPVTGHDRNAGR